MSDIIEVKFDLTPPSQDQLQELVADLSEDERHLLLEHGEEAPFCGVFLTEKREGYIPAACADCRCSKAAPNLKVALAGRALPHRSRRSSA